MNTDELIAALAREAVPVDAGAHRRRFAATLMLAALGSLALVLVLWGPRPDWDAASKLPMFWLKLAFPATVALAAAAWLHRLGLPGAHWRGSASLVVAAVSAMAAIAALDLASVPAEGRTARVLGATWLQCTVSIPLLSLPATALAFVAIRRLAPTRLTLGGAVAGLLGGALAAFAYAVHCVEMAPEFVATWYALGMLVSASVGAVFGRRVLRW